MTFTLDEFRERLLEFSLKAYDKEDKEVEITGGSNSFKLFIKPQEELSSIDSTGYEFWLFTGTNLDMLDGAKSEELYFEGSYFLNLGKGKKRNKYLYFTLGKIVIFHVLFP